MKPYETWKDKSPETETPNYIAWGPMDAKPLTRLGNTS